MITAYSILRGKEQSEVLHVVCLLVCYAKNIFPFAVMKITNF